jgi:hypothetical protein
MSTHFSVGLVVVLMLLGANIPFFTRGLLGVFHLQAGKTLPLRLLELLASYGVVGGISYALENNAGQVVAQGWEFYAITSAVFLTFAFPGFVYCYLLKRS